MGQHGADGSAGSRHGAAGPDSDGRRDVCVRGALLLDWAEVHLLDGAVSDALDLIRRRKTSFWSLYAGEYQLRWTLLELAAQLLLTAARVETELKIVRKDAKAMIEAYTRGIPGADSEPAMPWYLLDRDHRHLEHRYALLDLHLEGQHAQLEKLMAHGAPPLYGRRGPVAQNAWRRHWSRPGLKWKGRCTRMRSFASRCISVPQKARRPMCWLMRCATKWARSSSKVWVTTSTVTLQAGHRPVANHH